MSWLVYRITGSAMILGAIGFSTQIPMLFFSPIAGVYADRMDRYRLVIATQSCAMLQAFALAFLTLSGLIHVWHLFILSFLLGIINSFDMPIRQSFVVQMIENKADLGNAIALNSFLFNGARLVGPSVAGILIGMTSEGTCFLINGFSFLAVLVALLSMKIERREIVRVKDSLMNELRVGYNYVRDFIPIRYILLNLALMSFMGMPYAVLMPIFAKDILKGGPETLGFLMASTGLGAIVGALFLASRKTVLGLERLIVLSSFLFGTGIILFAISKSVLISAVLLTVTGFGMMVQMVGSNTIVQTILDEDMRGRVMSFFAVSFAGTMPFGSLYAGSMASRIGAPMTLTISGFVCVAAAFLFYRRLRAMQEVIRPIYDKMGILPGSPWP
jgi:MFS family permease